MGIVGKSFFVRYGVAAAAVVLALMLRLPLQPYLGTAVPYLFFFPAIMLACWYGGVGPGVFAQGLSLLFALYFFIPPIGSLQIPNAQTAIQVVLYIIVGGLILLIQDRQQLALKQVREISAQQAKAANELAALNARLEEIVTERTSQLQATTRELEGFCYSVAHDLKTPLRNLITRTRFIYEDHSEKLDEEGRAELSDIANDARNMARLVDDLLSFARLRDQEVDPAPTDMAAVARKVVADVKEQHPDIRVEIDLVEAPIVRCDTSMIGLALHNLVENAAKYRSKENPPRIEIGFEGKGSMVTFFVRDNGVGFDMQFSERMFLPFQRLHGAEFPGTGIGLANVKRIIQRQGGEIWAKSSPGHGATFFFTLPTVPERQKTVVRA